MRCAPRKRANYIALGEASLTAISRCASASIAYGPRRRLGYKKPTQRKAPAQLGPTVLTSLAHRLAYVDVTEITRRTDATVAATDVVADLQRFQDTILAQLDAVGLPTNDVVVDLGERDLLLRSLDGALRVLPDRERERSLFGGLDPRQAGRALRAFMDLGISSVLRSSTGQRQWAKLLDLLEPKLTRSTDMVPYDAVRAFTGPPHHLHADPKIARLATPRRVVHGRTTAPRQV